MTATAIPAAAPPTRITPANAVVVPTAAAVAAAAEPAAAPAAPAAPAPAAAAPAAAAPAAAPSATCAVTIAGEPVRIRASVRPSNLFIGSPFRSMVWYGIPSVLNSILKMDTRKPSQCQGMSDPIRSGSRRPSLGKRILRLRYATLRMNGGLRYAQDEQRTTLRSQDERGNHSGFLKSVPASATGRQVDERRLRASVEGFARCQEPPQAL